MEFIASKGSAGRLKGERGACIVEGAFEPGCIICEFLMALVIFEFRFREISDTLAL